MWAKFRTNFLHGLQLILMTEVVMRQNKKLILFPLLSTIVTFLFSIVFLWLMLSIAQMSPSFQKFLIDLILSEDITKDEMFSAEIDFLFLFLYWTAINFIILFFNSALVANAMAIMTGQRITIFAGLKIALQRIFKIMGWALIKSTVGFIFEVLERRFEIVGTIIVFLIDVAFSIASFLALPVILAENKNPVSALGRSSYLLHNTWGKQISGNLGFGLIFAMLYLIGFILACAAFVMLPKFYIAYAIILLLYFVFIAALQSAVRGIFQGAIYIYASTGNVPDGFDLKVVRKSFSDS